MSQANQSRLGLWVAGAFVLGFLGGFGVTLLRRHPASEYRAALQEQRAAL